MGESGSERESPLPAHDCPLYYIFDIADRYDYGYLVCQGSVERTGTRYYQLRLRVLNY